LGPALLLSLLLGSLSACGKSGGSPNLEGSTNPGTDVDVAPQDLAYPVRGLVLAPGESLAPILPTVTGDVTSYALLGSLPAGLTFDPGTGAISGTADELAETRVVRVVATNSVGSDEIALSIGVPELSNFAFGVNAAAGSVSSFVMDRSCGTLTPVDSLVVAATAPLKQVELDPAGRFLCAVDSLQLVCVGVDSESGALSGIESIAFEIAGSHGLALNPAGTVAYVASQSEGLLRSFAIDPETATIDPEPISVLTTGEAPTRPLVDPFGRYLILEHEFDDAGDRTPLHCYTLDPESGIPTLSTEANLVEVDPIEIVLDPRGESMYLTTTSPPEFANYVIHYVVDPTTGKPSFLDIEKASQGPHALQVTPDGNRVYVSNRDSANITLMEVDPGTGSLDKIISYASTSGVEGLSISADGSRMYVSDPSDMSITLHELEQDSGEILPGVVLASAASSEGLAILSLGGASELRASDLYLVGAESGDLQGYAIGAEDGSLTLSGGPHAAGEVVSAMAIHPSGELIYLSVQEDEGGGGENEVAVLGVQCDGSLVDLGMATDLLSGRPGSIVVHPSGSTLYVAVDVFDLLLAYRVEEDGSLTVLGSRPLGAELAAMAVDPSGRFLATVHRRADEVETDRAVVHAIDPLTGSLAVGVTTSLAGHPTGVAFDPAGEHAFILLEDDELETPDSVASFAVGVDGALTESGAPALTQPAPRAIELTPDGRFAFVTFEVSQLDEQGAPVGGGLLVYVVDPDSGALTNGAGLSQWLNSELSGEGPTRLALNHDGSRVYVLTERSHEVWVFDVDPDTGLPSMVEVEAVGPSDFAFGLRVTRE